MFQAASQVHSLPDPRRIHEGWDLLARRGYARTAVLPYFRSISRLPREVPDLVRFLKGRRRSSRAAWPRLYYEVFRRREPVLFDLFSIFSLSRPLERSRFTAIFTPSEAGLLETAGFVRTDGDRVQPLLRVYLDGPRVFLHDAPGSGVSLQARGYMARDSLRFARYLQDSLFRRRFRRALDLGTGCGIQAHVLAAHAGTVVGIDRNPRALRLARANAGLNGATGISFVHGDLSAPLRARTNGDGRFDLIVSNPPFIYLPRRLPDGHDPASDGGLLGITLPRRILASLDALLTPEGEARILTAVPRPAGERNPILERWIERVVLPRGFEVRLRFVEYLWRDDQFDAYRARGLKTPALAVAEVRRSGQPRLIPPRAPAPERLILARRLTARRVHDGWRQARSRMAALEPNRVRRRGGAAVTLLRRPAHVGHPPLVLNIEPSTRCPLDCISCARRERIAEGRRIDPCLFERVLGEVRPQSVRLYGSGEPLDHPDIDRLCRMGRTAGASVTLQTSLADEEMTARCRRALPWVSRIIVGLDAADPATYAAVRRGGDFAAVLEGMRALVRARALLDGNGPEILASFLVLGRNVGEMPSFTRLAFKLGLDGTLFYTLDGYGIEDRLDFLRDGISPEILRPLLQRAERAASRTGISTNLASLRRSTAVLRHGYGGGSDPGADGPAGGSPHARAGPCPRPWLSTYLRVNGDVRPCARYAYGPEGHLGNAAEGPFESVVWNGAAYRELRTAFTRRERALPSACVDCPVPAVEGGRLPALLWSRGR